VAKTRVLDSPLQAEVTKLSCPLLGGPVVRPITAGLPPAFFRAVGRLLHISLGVRELARALKWCRAPVRGARWVMGWWRWWGDEVMANSFAKLLCKHVSGTPDENQTRPMAAQLLSPPSPPSPWSLLSPLCRRARKPHSATANLNLPCY